MHNTRHMSARLIIALALSLVLHGSLLFSGAFPASRPRPAPPLQASLRPLPDLAKLLEPPPVADTLLKNTLADERPAPPASPPPPPRPKEASAPSRRAPAAPRETEAVRRKLAEYVLYPEQAWRLGQEGTVDLFVELAGDGRVEDVRVVASSGFPLLDNAAVKGFYAVGRLPGKSGVWHYTFRLE